MSKNSVAASVAVGLILPHQAFAQENSIPEPTRGEDPGLTLFNRTPRELWRPLSADRPDATESPYTVNAGVFQLEISFLEYSSREEDGQRLDAFSVAPFNLKVGVLDNADLQILFDPYLSEESVGGATANGAGNFTLRWKQNLWGNDDGPLAIAVMPYISLPTGDEDVAPDEVEGGVIIPVGIELPAGWGLGFQAELGFVDEDGDREEVFSHTVVLGKALTEELGAFVEYIGEHDLDGEYDPSVSAGMTYSITPDLQLDGGVVVGLGGEEEVTLFSGVTVRF